MSNSSPPQSPSNPSASETSPQNATPNGSRPFRLAASDVKEVVRTMTVAGLAAGLVAILQVLSAMDFGSWNTVMTAVFTVLMRLAQQWVGNTTQPRFSAPPSDLKSSTDMDSK